MVGYQHLAWWQCNLATYLMSQTPQRCHVMPVASFVDARLAPVSEDPG